MREVIERVMSDENLAAGREQARRDAWAFPGESVTRTVDYLVAKHAELTGNSEEESTNAEEESA